ncbi:hypothetical protein, partial [Bacteroides finegoldii]|uniref:hypothetical protein n=1 Tax=Bacteroides finegoldii TaxID=338188 RepID=UPI001E4158A2
LDRSYFSPSGIITRKRNRHFFIEVAWIATKIFNSDTRESLSILHIYSKKEIASWYKPLSCNKYFYSFVTIVTVFSPYFIKLSGKRLLRISESISDISQPFLFNWCQLSGIGFPAVPNS